MGRARIVAVAAAMAIVAAVAPAAAAGGAATSRSIAEQVAGLPAPLSLRPEGVTPDEGPVPPQVLPVPAGATDRRTTKPEADVGIAPLGAARSSSRRVVEVRHDGDRAAVEARVRSLGGTVHGPAGDRALEAELARDALAALRADPHVVEVATPSLATIESSTATTGQEVGQLNADDWHAVGIDGTGTKVGIIDSFDDGYWNAARASGDVPAPAGTFCRSVGTSCDIWAGDRHGVAVAEIVHEVAPGAQIYLATVTTAADFQAAIDHFAARGVKVVTRSQTAEYDGPGNGTGTLASVVDSAVAKGMVYLNSAGNSAGSSAAGRTGSYWRSAWSDTDGDGYLNFSGVDELLRTRCWYFNGLRWSDFGLSAASRTDYDVEIWNDAGTSRLGQSVLDQQAGASPIEPMNGIPCTGGEYVNVAVRLYDPGSGTAGDVLELMVNGVGVEYWQNAGSATGPMADSANPGMLTVGAIDPPTGTTIASYSSQGPTNDGRVKPDIAAVACVSSASYAPDCFNGTSASTPVAAGAVALAWAAGQHTTPAQVATYVRDQTVDRGAAGTDNVFGRGQLVLDRPASSAPYSSWAAFVTRQMSDLVGRAATSAERQRWVFSLSLGGTSPAAMVASLRTSTENTTNVDPVARLYWAYFLRIPDKAGLDYWIAQKRGGRSLTSISQAFAVSPEFRTLYGTLTNRQFVERVYVNVLGRPGEPDGVTYWTDQLTSGARTRGTVMTGFSESPEYRTRMRASVDVAVVASALLRRKPTTAEVAARQSSTTTQIASWALSDPGYVRP